MLTYSSRHVALEAEVLTLGAYYYYIHVFNYVNKVTKVKYIIIQNYIQ